MKLGVAAAIVLALAAVVSTSHVRTPAPEVFVARTTALVAAAPAAPGMALGGGVGEWWSKHGGQLVEVLGCAVTGVGVAGVIVGTITGYGAFALVVAGLACLV